MDPLAEVYRDAMTAPTPVYEALAHKHAALLVIDVQYLDAAPGYGVFQDATRSGVRPEAQEYYFEQLRKLAVPNIARLQATFRSLRLEVIHTRIMSLTQDGRDRSAGHKRLGLHAPPGSKESEFLPEVAPVADELVMNKTASGVFSATNIEYVLRNMGIDALFVCGVYTNECVSSTVRVASDLGFFTTLVEDACATVTPELQANSINVLKDRYCRVLTSEQVVAELLERGPSSRQHL